MVLPPDRLDEPAVAGGFVTLHECRFLHKAAAVAPGHVNHHRNAVHHAPAGDLPGSSPPPCMAQLASRDKADSALLA